MCGRYSFRFTADDADPQTAAIVSMMEREHAGAYKTGEIFPGDAAPAVVAREGRLQSVPAVFGFPARDGKRLIINARAETAAEKPLFAGAMQSRRIILPADGFYEWSRDADKTKYLFTLEAKRTVYLCGLFRIEDGVLRFVILTRPANDSMREIHDRMPVIAAAEEVRPYLTDPAAAKALLARTGPALHRIKAEGSR